ncbi:S-layer homology domain-containing protein [Paenibacillus sp. CGMCC 1.16610]|nr:MULTISPECIES: S-layer homology domain-containing protein [Paenibacillus]MBA2939709.1 S-layer homology domain-containing protein [Paenibacillus sp. CGMCC 1.16610]
MQKHLQQIRLKGTMAVLLAVGSVSAFPAWALATPVEAATVQLTIGNASAETNSAFTIPVTATPTNGEIASYNMQIDFDPKAFQIHAITSKYGSSDLTTCSENTEGCFQASFDNENGWIRVIWIDPSTGSTDPHPIKGKQVLFDISGTTKASTGNKTFAIDTKSTENFSFTDGHFIDKEPQQLKPEAQIIENSFNVSDPPSNSGTGTAPTIDVKVYIDGKLQEKSATAITTTINGRVTTSITVDNDKVIQQLEHNTVKTLMLPFRDNTSQVVVGELNGKLVKAMEGKDASVQIQTDRATYTLPAAQIRIDNISHEIGSNVSLEDIKIRVKIADGSAKQSDELKLLAQTEQFNNVTSPVDFEVEATFGDKQVQVHQFNNYVERSLALPDGVDPTKMTTGIVLHNDGTVTHVPTRIHKEDNKYYADIKSLTNSTYSVIWNPKTFTDVTSHWSRTDVSDLASRLIVQGTSKDAFSPDRAITRAEFTTILLRALGLYSPKEAQAVSFSDVTSSDWFEPQVTTAVSYKLVSGYEDGTFQPNGLITRAEAMKMLEQALALVQLDVIKDAQAINALLAAFTDQDEIQPWARQAIAASVSQGIAEGADNKLSPNANITRAQTAAMVRRLLIKAHLIND